MLDRALKITFSVAKRQRAPPLNHNFSHQPVIILEISLSVIFTLVILLHQNRHLTFPLTVILLKPFIFH